MVCIALQGMILNKAYTDQLCIPVHCKHFCFTMHCNAKAMACNAITMVCNAFHWKRLLHYALHCKDDPE